MSVQLSEVAQGKYLEVHVSGKLDRETYQRLVPLAEEQIAENGKIRVLFAMHDFHGWDAGALWEDIKFDAKHFSDFERIAIVGERKWERGMAVFCKPFTTASVRYYNDSDIDEAREWLMED
ncbi:MAG: STAS/SEC14 domain-containing protein [Rhodopirellula sp. JB055]|uniref:STAS/SEC14 domain-containing protein n=1 Tax=Rhodopirellula sp. JB055 TaxID=3342846 RepID=UPI00370A83BA